MYLYGVDISTTAENNIVNGTYYLLDPIVSNDKRVWQKYDAERPMALDVYLFRDIARGWVLANAVAYAEDEQGHTTSQPVLPLGATCYYSEQLGADDKPSVGRSPWNVKWVVVDGLADKLPTLQSNQVPSFSKEEFVYPEVDTDDNGVTYLKKDITLTSYLTGRQYTITTAEATTGVATRYDTVELVIGKIYRFSFTKNFRSLGYIRDIDDPEHSVMTGTYRVDKIMSYKDVIAGGIDVYNSLYVPCNVSEEQYKLDEPTFINTIFYKLVDPRNEKTVIYMPLSFVDGTPDGSVREYNKFLLVANLGVFSDKDMIYDMINIFTQLLEARWGVSQKDKQFNTDIINLQTYDSVWLTPDEYDLLNESRDYYKKNSTNTLLEDLFNTELNKLKEENAKLESKVIAYEEILSRRS